MNKVRVGLSLGIVIGLCACTTSPIVATGPQSYSFSATRCGLCVPVTSYVTEQAGKYCQTQNKDIVVKSVTSNNMQPMFPGSATINFECVVHSAVTPLREVIEECKLETASPELDPIRHKVELYRAVWDAPPPFEMASNESYPTDLERQAISKWATMRDACIARQRSVPRVPASATAIQATVIEQDAAFGDEVAGKVSALIVALYQGKLTYGEFAQKRYEFGRDGAAAEREFRQATLMSDQQRAIQAQQLAQQGFQNRLLAWSAYLQAVNSRPAQTQIQMQQNVTIQK